MADERRGGSSPGPTIEPDPRDAEERYRPLLNASPDGIAILDLEGRVLMASRMSVKMLACTREDEITGRPITDFIVPEDREKAKARIERMLEGERTGRTGPGEYRGLRADGTTFDIDVNGEFIRDGHGKPVQMIFVVRDVTARRQAEEAMAAALKEKEQLLREVHHRVKNNLQVITSLLRLETARNEEPATKRVLKDMQSRILSMALLHETLYKSGHFGRVNLGAYLQQLAQQFFRAQTFAAGPVELTLDLASVEVDMDQAIPCGLIVNELMTNSLKHAFPSGQSGAVRIHLRSEESGPVVLQVSDTGVGLPGDFDTRRATSLGLHLVTDLAKQLSGELVIGPGSAFTVTFIRKFTSGSISRPK